MVGDQRKFCFRASLLPCKVPDRAPDEPAGGYHHVILKVRQAESKRRIREGCYQNRIAQAIGLVWKLGVIGCEGWGAEGGSPLSFASPDY